MHFVSEFTSNQIKRQISEFVPSPRSARNSFLLVHLEKLEFSSSKQYSSLYSTIVGLSNDSNKAIYSGSIHLYHDFETNIWLVNTI